MKKDNNTNTLIEELNKNVAATLKQYKEGKILRAEGVELAKQLPEFITSIDWYTFMKQGENKWYLETWVLGDDNAGDNLLRQLKIWGAQGMKSHFKSFNKSWFYDCVVAIGDIELTIKIDGGSKPPNCTIEEIKEVKEVITYKAICEETGEEL